MGIFSVVILWLLFRICYRRKRDHCRVRQTMNETTKVQADKPSSARPHSAQRQKPREVRVGPAPPRHFPRPSRGRAGTLRTSHTCKVRDRSSFLSLPWSCRRRCRCCDQLDSPGASPLKRLFPSLGPHAGSLALVVWRARHQAVKVSSCLCPHQEPWARSGQGPGSGFSTQQLLGKLPPWPC